MFSFLLTGISNAPMLLSKLWPLLIPLALFTVFMVKNGGWVAVGDKEHHEFSLHIAQLCYFSIATAAMHPASTLLDPRRSVGCNVFTICTSQLFNSPDIFKNQKCIVRWLWFVSCVFRCVKAFPVRTLTLLVASLLLLHIGTISHPFILSVQYFSSLQIYPQW